MPFHVSSRLCIFTTTRACIVVCRALNPMEEVDRLPEFRGLFALRVSGQLPLLRGGSAACTHARPILNQPPQQVQLVSSSEMHSFILNNQLNRLTFVGDTLSVWSATQNPSGAFRCCHLHPVWAIDDIDMHLSAQNPFPITSLFNQDGQDQLGARNLTNTTGHQLKSALRRHWHTYEIIHFCLDPSQPSHCPCVAFKFLHANKHS